MKNLKKVAQCIDAVLDNCGFNDVTDSSGHFIVREFDDGSDRTVDVYKSTNDGNPHYVIYCSYEDGTFDYLYTEDLSVEQLEGKLEEFYKAEVGRQAEVPKKEEKKNYTVSIAVDGRIDVQVEDCESFKEAKQKAYIKVRDADLNTMTYIDFKAVNAESETGEFLDY